MNTKYAVKNSWKNSPLSSPKKIDISLIFTEEEFEKIKAGLIPSQMEDKWFIFFEDEWLYFHRSWTGFCIYKAKFDKCGENYYVNEFYAERDLEKYNEQNDVKDMKILLFLIKSALLKEDCREMLLDIVRNKNNSGSDDEKKFLEAWHRFGNIL